MSDLPEKVHGNAGLHHRDRMHKDEERSSTIITLKELGPRHKQVLSLLAQGVTRQQIAEITDYTPEYVTWLARQPICQDYLRQVNEFVDIRLQSLGEKVVEVITDTLDHGSSKERLSAARLQMEATGRLGAYREAAHVSPSEERLERLSNRLLDLLRTQRAASETHVYTPEGDQLDG